ncbi:MAG: DUF2294 domain-containing protein [Actinomycetota bacterium]|nr:DUF2294 domain-containing protein [Actinomycetota bacterium]
MPGEVLAAISSEMVRLKAHSFGKGPVEAKTYECDDFLFCVMRGVATRAEQVLISSGDKRVVRDFRLAFQERMRPEFVGAVDRITNRRVLTYESQILFEPDTTVEIFLLENGAEAAEAPA